MKTLVTALKSRTVWTIIVMFVIGGVQATEPFLSTQAFLFVSGLLSLLATYFKIKPSQAY